MDAPAAFGHGHALHPVDAAFELQFGEHAGAGDIGDDFLEPADFGGVHADRLDPPALLRGIAFVHAEQIGGEQRGFLAAGAGADFEHGRARIGRIARQHGNRKLALGLGQLGLEPLDLFLGQCAHFGIGIVDLLQLGQLAAQGADLLGHLRHRLQLGIIAARGDEGIALERARGQPRLQFGKALRDLGEALLGDGH